MTPKDIFTKSQKTIKISSLLFLGKWILLATVIGLLAGSASALLLASLQWVTHYRNDHSWIVALLPLGGLIIGLTYHYWGQDVVKGNNQLLEEFHHPRQVIPLKMAPLVLFGTVATHLFGGSAGREGTAVQMGGAIADQLTKIFRLTPSDRRILLISGISAGFASVFGTPLAGAIFALEVLVIGKMRYEALIPAFITAIIADYSCRWWAVGHSHYSVDFVPDMAPSLLFWALLAGLCFGLTALFFSRAVHFFSQSFSKAIKYPPFRPLVGGLAIAFVVFTTDNTRYLGLGLPVISEAFNSPVLPYDFILKLLFTTFTLGAGFKGGEVTPLFFIGATLGNALSLFIPLPVALLAGMGFVAVFSGATNTPLACTVMGMELFGMESGVYIALACITAYLFSGHSGIYTSQIVGSAKQPFDNGDKGKNLNDIYLRKKAPK